MNRKNLDFDLIVCGGGLPGVCAAIAAARGGARTLLIQDRPVLGGNSSSEAGVPPHGATALGHNRNARETGILEELRMEYARRSPLADNRQVWDRVLLDWCRREKGLQVMLGARVLSVKTAGRRIRSVEALQASTECMYTLSGALFVDATGDGFIAAEAGAAFRWGREGRRELGEGLAPVKADRGTLGVSAYLIAQKRGYPVRFSAPAWARRCPDCASLRGRPHEINHIFHGNSLAPDGSTVRLFWWFELGGDRDVIRDSVEIHDRLLAELFGTWDHLKNGCSPETRQALEDYDLVWWSTIPLRRESRRIEGAYLMSERDLLEPTLFEDRVAHGGFCIDLHPPAGLDSEEPACDQTFLNEPYSIPLRSLCSRDIANLFLAGRCMSASHVALASLRVMFTLGAAGQAVGTAAALCQKHKLTPAGLLKNHIDELQQTLLLNDQYIIGVRNSDRRDHALFAAASATSDMALSSEGHDDSLELVCDIAQQLPLSDTTIDGFSVFLSSEAGGTAMAEWEVRASVKLGQMAGSRLLRSGRFAVEHRTGRWHSVRHGFNFEPGELVWIVFKRNPGLRWWFDRREAFGSRIAIRYDGPEEPRGFHGRARRAPRPDEWLCLNHHGRLPAAAEDWIKPVCAGAFPVKLYATLNVRLDPIQRPYGAKNVINGFSRAEDRPNLWISDPASGFPQALRLDWPAARSIRTIMLSFDTDLDHEDRMYGFPREKYRFPFPVPACVRDYEIAAQVGGGWQILFETTGNWERRRIHRLDRAVRASAVRIMVKSANGTEAARIFELRVY